MAENMFSLPLVGSRTREPVATQDTEATNFAAAEMTKFEVRLVENQRTVTDPIFLPAVRCRSIKKLVMTFNDKLAKLDNRTWLQVHTGYGNLDVVQPVLLLQRTVGKGKDLWVEVDWNQPRPYTSWFDRNIGSGQNAGSSIKVEIHVKTDGLATGVEEYLGQKTKEELEEERRQAEEEAWGPTHTRAYQRFKFLHEQDDLEKLKREEHAMRSAMPARDRRARYQPKEPEYAIGTKGWFVGETYVPENEVGGDDDDDDDDDDVYYDSEDDEVVAKPHVRVADLNTDVYYEEENEEEEEEEEGGGDATDIDG
ncbi:uncharacterized protein A1O5_11516 [Cladophialophora psammophila CBS 110553]|uniref:Uncharacterized protein n=1 Tax=Cladophialophora psammophila CBS 110553 TaxID=1182543 RepID=W9W5T7_9EURO|nr:uncharacterized protein A1O5_11516 [Cladophialophora psammophila CBS 110553]EXJ63467.1 hypothetical protein A1O5_11516 [Cladophialophora psammophila CBS 110553]